MTTNLHDKMLAAIDAYFSASDAVEEEAAENLLLDVRDELRKHKLAEQPAHPVSGFGLAAVGQKHFGNPIPEAWYAAARELMAEQPAPVHQEIKQTYRCDDPECVVCCPAPAQQEIDWKDQYEKQKRRADMWVAKYEADIGPLEKAGPVAEQPAQQEPSMLAGQGRELFEQLLDAGRELRRAEREPERWGCVGPGLADIAWDKFSRLASHVCTGIDSPQPPAQQDIPDLIAGALGVSRGTAYDMMREALAEQSAQQEPVAWIYSQGKSKVVSMNRVPGVRATPLYTTPQPPAQPLTDEQIDELRKEHLRVSELDGYSIKGQWEFARAIEAAHGITKGNT